MAVSFNNIPSALRVPLFYAELDGSAAAGGSDRPRSLLIGQVSAAATAAASVPVQVSSLTEAATLFGIGSPLYRMVKLYKQQNITEELWCLPVPEGSTAATWTLTTVVTTAVAGTYSLYVGADYVPVAVTASETAPQIASAIKAAIDARPDLPVSAAVGEAPNTHVCTLTFKSKGTIGNQLNISANYLGTAGGQSTPGGVTITIADGVAGATDPTLATSLAGLGDETFDYIGHHFNDSTSLIAVDAEMNDTTGRWSPNRQLFGIALTAMQESVADLGTAASTHNGQHQTMFGYEEQSPSPAYEFVGAALGQMSIALANGPARPLQTLPLVGILPAPPSYRFTISERNTLLYDGIATSYYAGGYVRIERAVTMYRVNAFSVVDDAYLDVTTLTNLQYQLRDLKSRITGKFGRHSLANDGTRFGPGVAVVTPNTIRNEIVAAYREYESMGLVENTETMLSYLIVERNALDHNRVDVLYPPDLVNQFNVLAMLAQFRLQYAAAAV